MALIDAAVIHAHGHQPSMLQDAAPRRRTEIDVLNGGIVRAGRETDVPTPLNQAVAALIDGRNAPGLAVTGRSIDQSDTSNVCAISPCS